MMLQYIPMEDQDADILTKVLTKRKLEYHKDMIGVKDNPFIVERECWDSTRKFTPMPSALRTYIRVGPTVLFSVHVYFIYRLIKMENKL